MDDDQVYCVAKADDEFKSQQWRAILQNLLLFFCIRISQDRKAWRKEQLAYEHYILDGHGIKHRFRC